MRRSVWALVVLILIMVLASGCASIKAKKFAKLLDDDRYDEALAIYKETTNAATQSQMENVAISKIQSVHNNYAREEFSYQTAAHILEMLESFIADESIVDTERQFLNAMKFSHLSYRRAIEDIHSKDYHAAIHELIYVMEEDVKYYAKSQSLLEEALTELYDTKVNEAVAFYENMEYRQAADSLTLLLDYYPEDEAIKTNLTRYKHLATTKDAKTSPQDPENTSKDLENKSLGVELVNRDQSELVISIDDSVIIGVVQRIMFDGITYKTYPCFKCKVYASDLEKEIGEVVRSNCSMAEQNCDSTWLPIGTKLYKLKGTDTSEAIAYSHMGVYFRTAGKND